MYPFQCLVGSRHQLYPHPRDNRRTHPQSYRQAERPTESQRCGSGIYRQQGRAIRIQLRKGKNDMEMLPFRPFYMESVQGIIPDKAGACQRVTFPLCVFQRTVRAIGKISEVSRMPECLDAYVVLPVLFLGNRPAYHRQELPEAEGLPGFSPLRPRRAEPLIADTCVGRRIVFGHRPGKGRRIQCGRMGA